jgi:hypothetical protein
MNIRELKESRFLSKEDCTPPILVTIDGCKKENMALQGQPEELKATLTFREPGVKPMVLNSINGQLIAQALGSDETDDWRGQKIVLYNDPSITFGGKLTGGIRARAPRKTPGMAGNPAPVTAAPTEPEEDPFGL